MRPGLAIDRTPSDAANRPEAKSNASGKGTADETCVHNSVYALRRNHSPRTIDNQPAFCFRVIFLLTPPGTYTVLYALNGTSDSSVPLGVIQASDGNLYGTRGHSGPGPCSSLSCRIRSSRRCTISRAEFFR